MPARVKFGDLNLNAEAYLIHAYADPSGTHPKLGNVFVYVFARQSNNAKTPLADPTGLTGDRDLTIYWAGDANPTHEFRSIHLVDTLLANRTQYTREVLLKFGYEEKDGTPGWIASGEEKVNISLHYPSMHESLNYYLGPQTLRDGGHHSLAIEGQELSREEDDTWKVATGRRQLLAFEYGTGSGVDRLSSDSDAPSTARLTMMSFRDNRCRVLNTLLEQDRQIRSAAPDAAEPACALTLTMPSDKSTKIPFTGCTGGLVVYVEHRNFWPQVVGESSLWEISLDASGTKSGKIGDVLRLGAKALTDPSKPRLSTPPDVGLESVVFFPNDSLAQQLATVRA